MPISTRASAAVVMELLSVDLGREGRESVMVVVPLVRVEGEGDLDLTLLSSQGRIIFRRTLEFCRGSSLLVLFVFAGSLWTAVCLWFLSGSSSWLLSSILVSPSFNEALLSRFGSRDFGGL